MRGRLIVLEGGEASGKTTQAVLLAERLGASLTREPGGTATGERIRALLLDPALPAVTARAEALLMLAARAQHVAEVIEPALGGGGDVVCDRFAGSTLAYQGYGRGLDPGELAGLSAWAAAGVEPDAVLLLQVDAATAAARRALRSDPDRIEAEGSRFFDRVEAGFAALAAADPARWRIVDGRGSIEEVHQRVVTALATLEGWTSSTE